MHDNGKQEPSHCAAPPSWLFESLNAAIETRSYSRRTGEAYLQWIKRFIVFSGKRHPRELGAPEVMAFLSHLAVKRQVAAATQNQALAALLFLYKEVLGEPLPWLDDIVRAKRPFMKPTVLTGDEAQRLLANMRGPKWLMASMLYGAGLRLRECLKPASQGCRFRLPANPGARPQGGQRPHHRIARFGYRAAADASRAG